MDLKVLSNRGYVIKKQNLELKEINKIKNELTVKPITFGDYNQNIKPFKLYKENENKLYLPKSYGIKMFNEPDFNYLNQNAVKVKLRFNGVLRDNQKPVIDAFMNATQKTVGGGIVCVGCGFGKTILSLYILSLLGYKTLVIVHKEFLAYQWIERINEFLPEARIGKIQQNVIDIEDKEIVIGMLQSISMKDYEKTVFESFGFVILDECHHLGAEVFSKALPKITTQYMLGLSATPDRKDGLRRVFEYYLGDMVFCIKGREPEKVLVKLVEYNCLDENYKQEFHNFKGTIIVPKMISQLCEDPVRLQIIINYLKILVVEGRKILILSERREHLSNIKKIIDNLEIGSSGFYVGGSKQEVLKESESKQIILGTFQMASEGMDIASLNTVILSTPKSDIEQSVGRILREKKENRNFTPLIIDIIDQPKNFKRQAMIRKKFYKSNNYIIETEKYLGSELSQKKPPPKEISIDFEQMTINDFQITNENKTETESEIKQPINFNECLL